MVAKKRLFAREARNPHGLGGWKKGESGNPAGNAAALAEARNRGNSAGVIYNGKSIDLQALAKTHTRAAVVTMVTIMRDKSVSAATRLTAAEAILSRGHGKPIQPHSNPDLSPIDWNSMGTEELLVAMRKLETMLGEAPAFPGHMPDSEDLSTYN
jgi:hypothetical protein